MKNVIFVMQILMFLFLFITAVKIKSDFVLLDNEPEDLLYWMESHQSWNLCFINNTVRTYGMHRQIENSCAKNNLRKNNSLKHALFYAGTPNTGPPICGPLSNGQNWSWNCEKGLSLASVTVYRNCTVRCNDGYFNVKKHTRRCSVDLEWLSFGEEREPYCRKIQDNVFPSSLNPTVWSSSASPGIGGSVLNNSVFPSSPNSKVLMSTASSETGKSISSVSEYGTTIENRKTEEVKKDEESEISVQIPVIIGAVSVSVVVVIVIFVVIRCLCRQNHGQSRSSRSYDPVSSQDSSSASGSNQSDQCNRDSKGDKLVKCTEDMVKRENNSVVSREIEDSSISEDSGSTLAEVTISFNQSYHENVPLVDGTNFEKQNVNDRDKDWLSNNLVNFHSLSVSSLNQDNDLCQPSSSVIEAKRCDQSLDDKHPQITDALQTVNLPPAPTLSSSLYSSTKGSKTMIKNAAERTQNLDKVDKNMRDKMAAITVLTASSQTQQTAEVCNLTIKDAMENLSIKNFQTLGYYLDPDSDKAKSWFGLTLSVLNLKMEKVKSIRHHSLGNPENGHFMNTLEIYIAQGKHLSDIVQYFVQPGHERYDVILLIKEFHSDCPVCKRYYLKLTQKETGTLSREAMREISIQYHRTSNPD